MADMCDHMNEFNQEHRLSKFFPSGRKIKTVFVGGDARFTGGIFSTRII